MPSMLMLQDSMFPRFTDEVSDSEKIEVMHDYLYQLLEQLRYTLSNLGAENFNDNSLAEIGEGITGELDGQVQVIRQSLEGINGTLYGTATGDGILTRLENAEGSVAEIALTAGQLKAALSNDEGNLMSLSATAHALTLRINDAEDNISKFKQDAKNITMTVSNNSTYSRIVLNAFGTEIKSDKIKFTGFVVFSALSEKDGVTTINGAKIDTCTINGSTLNLYYDHETWGTSRINFVWGDSEIGVVSMEYNEDVPDGNANKTVNIKSNSGAAIKLWGVGGISLNSAAAIYMEANKYITLYSDDIYLRPKSGTGLGWQFKTDGIYYNGSKKVAV